MILAATTVFAIGQPFVPTWVDLRPFVLELWLIATMVALLLAPFFTRRANLACPAIAIAGLALGLISMIAVGTGPDVVGEHLRGLLLFDGMAFAWKVLLALFTGGVVVTWYATVSQEAHEGDAAEFFLLLIGATLGMSLMVSTGNLLMLFMTIELASLPSYVLAGFRKTHRPGAEASLKYVLFGAACSSTFAYGLSLLYGMYGTLQVDEIARAMAAGGGASPALLAVALLGVLVGVGFKIAAVPFHFWCPDVFEGARLDVTLFLSVASKGAALVLLVRLAQTFAGAFGYDPDSGVLTTLAATIGTIGIVTATAGNTAAFVQTNLKRLLAYSSIAHAGYVVCAASLLIKSRGSEAGYDPGALSVQSMLAYLSVYLFMNLGAFAVVGVVYRQTGEEDLRGYAGLGRRSPVLAACMAAFMVSLIGIPPLAGFWAKVNIMAALIGNGGWWWAPAVAIGVNTILSLYYYLRVVKAMYFDPSDAAPLRVAPLGTTIAVVCATMLLAMFVGWGAVLVLADRFGPMDHRGSDTLTNAVPAVAPAAQ